MTIDVLAYRGALRVWASLATRGWAPLQIQAARAGVVGAFAAVAVLVLLVGLLVVGGI